MRHDAITIYAFDDKSETMNQTDHATLEVSCDNPHLEYAFIPLDSREDGNNITVIDTELSMKIIQMISQTINVK
jgi:hypothetical protein